MASLNTDDGLTMTVLGCGTMGVAILSGIMSSLVELKAGKAPEAPSTASSPAEELPERLPLKFIACDSRKEQEKVVKATLGHYNFPLTALTNENVKGAQEADIILLACKPQGVKEILTEKGMREALAGKILISILAGVSSDQIEETLYKDTPDETNKCWVVRVMPNTASFVRESMTVIATKNPPLPPHYSALVTWIFTRIGRVVHLPPDKMDACTALCGSGPAFFALVLEAMADGAVAMGIPRAEAQLMATQTMRGTTALVLNGEHPAILRDKVSTPGGCTIGGLLVLEEGMVRGTVARAVREATVVASKLGQGEQGVNVNGTRR